MSNTKRITKLEQKLFADWKSDAIDLIKRGAIGYNVLKNVCVRFGEPETLADELFQRANVPVPTDTCTYEDKLRGFPDTLKVAIVDAVETLFKRGDNALEAFETIAGDTDE